MGRPKKINKDIEMTATQDVHEVTKPAEIVESCGMRELEEIQDRKMVTGTFHIVGKKSGVARIGALVKYKGDDYKTHFFQHGKTYTIPKWKADWLNGYSLNDPKTLDRGMTPRCHVKIHTEQYTDLTQKHPLAEPQTQNLYSFTPVARW